MVEVGHFGPSAYPIVTLAKGFFPPRPAEDLSLTGTEYPQPCEADVDITAEQIVRQMQRLKPYKAPGPDGIPNIVLTKCAHLLANRLMYIYEAALDRNLLYKP